MKLGRRMCAIALALVLCLGAALAEDGEEIYRQAVEASEAGDYDRGMELVMQAAELGYAYAQYDLGYCYLLGQGVEQDEDRAMELFQAGAAQGSAECTFCIGFMYDNGLGVEDDSAKAIEWYERAVALGDSVSMNNLACIYYAGDGVERDMEKALEWFRKCAEADYASGQAAVGQFCEYGYGVAEVDKAEAARWYGMAADQGDCEAMFRLGMLYRRGQGVERDEAKAEKLFARAREAVANDREHTQSKSDYLLGVMEMDGLGGEKDVDHGLELLTASAGAGDDEAQYALGCLYRDGGDVEKNPVRAAMLFAESAEHWNMMAQEALGELYLSGEGVSRDAERAFELIRASAEQDWPRAMRRLSEMYERGEGVAADAAQAWSARAAALGE